MEINLLNLRNSINKACLKVKPTKGKGKKDLGDFIETHEVHKIGSELWNKLCSLSLNYIELKEK